MVILCLIAPAYPYSTPNDVMRQGLSLTFQPRKQSGFGPFPLSHNMDAFLPLLAQLPASCPLKVGAAHNAASLVSINQGQVSILMAGALNVQIPVMASQKQALETIAVHFTNDLVAKFQHWMQVLLSLWRIEGALGWCGVIGELPCPSN